jgi:hypothetical protein
MRRGAVIIATENTEITEPPNLTPCFGVVVLARAVKETTRGGWVEGLGALCDLCGKIGERLGVLPSEARTSSLWASTTPTQGTHDRNALE